MAPFADAVGFVNGNTGKFALGVNNAEDPAETVALAEFWRYVQEAGQRVAALEVVEYSGTVFLGGCTVDGFDADIGVTHRGDLIVHQSQ